MCVQSLISSVSQMINQIVRRVSYRNLIHQMISRIASKSNSQLTSESSFVELRVVSLLSLFVENAAPEENLFGPSPAYNGPGPTTRMDDFLLPTATPKLQPDDINNIPDEPIVKPTEPDVTPKPAVDLSDQDRDVPRLIKSRGFEVQTHTVTTVDNYNLTLFRIVNPRQSLPGRPVVLQHGLVGSAADWLVNQIGGHIDEILPNGVVGANLGFELAKRGFDVWLSNSRGNTYSPIPDGELNEVEQANIDFLFD